MTAKPARIQVDFENNAEVWWDAFQQAEHIPVLLHPLLAGQDEVATEDWLAAESAMRWAATLPGWDSEDSRARHPLLLSEDT